MKNKTSVEKLTLSAVFLAAGNCAAIFDWTDPGCRKYAAAYAHSGLALWFCMRMAMGLLTGFVLPIMRSALLSMPPMMPTAMAMAFEMAVYGAVTGLLYQRLTKNMASVYISLVSAMIAGRLVWGAVSIIFYGIAGKSFGWQFFLGGALLNAVPGIILQLVLIPLVILTLKRAKVME